MTRPQQPGRFFPVAHEGQAPPEFGLDAHSVRVVTIALDAAADNRRFEIAGNVLWCVRATSLNTSIEVAFQDTHGDRLPFGEGSFIKGIPFSRLFLSWEAQPGQTITLFSVVDRTGRFEVVNPAQTFSNVVQQVPPIMTTLADLTVAASADELVFPASAGRAEAIITNLHASDAIRIGDSDVGAARGVRLGPGETLFLHTSAAVHAHNPGSNAIDLARVEVRQ